MFQIDSIGTTVARNKNGEPEQLIVLTTTADISTRDLSKTLQIRLLPKRKLSGVEKAAEVETEGDLEKAPKSPPLQTTKLIPMKIQWDRRSKKLSFGKVRPMFPTMFWTLRIELHSRRWNPKSRLIGNMLFECALKAKASFMFV